MMDRAGFLWRVIGAPVAAAVGWQHEGQSVPASLPMDWMADEVVGRLIVFVGGQRAGDIAIITDYDAGAATVTGVDWGKLPKPGEQFVIC